MPFTEPTRDDLRARYPTFTDVADATIDYWLNDAHRFVDQSWSEGDYAPGLIARAAYEMDRRKVPGIAGSDIAGFAAAGVSDFKSGTFQARFSDEAIKVAVAGGYASSLYGMEFAELLARNVPTFGVTSPGVAPCWGSYGYPYP